MSRRPYEFDNFVIADGSAAVLDLAVNRRSFPAAAGKICLRKMNGGRV